MHSWKFSPWVWLYELSKQTISEVVVLEVDPVLLHASVHGEPEVVLKPTALGKRLLSRTVTMRALDPMREDRGPWSQSPNMMDKQQADTQSIFTTPNFLLQSPGRGGIE